MRQACVASGQYKLLPPFPSHAFATFNNSLARNVGFLETRKEGGQAIKRVILQIRLDQAVPLIKRPLLGRFDRPLLGWWEHGKQSCCASGEHKCQIISFTCLKVLIEGDSNRGATLDYRNHENLKRAFLPTTLLQP